MGDLKVTVGAALRGRPFFARLRTLGQEILHRVSASNHHTLRRGSRTLVTTGSPGQIKREFCTTISQRTLDLLKYVWTFGYTARRRIPRTKGRRVIRVVQHPKIPRAAIRQDRLA